MSDEIKKGVTPPPVKASDADVIAYVASTRGAIGYVSAGAAVPVDDAQELAEAAAALLSNPSLRQERGDAARRIVAENRGALQRLMGLLEPLLAEFPDS